MIPQREGLENSLLHTLALWKYKVRPYGLHFVTCAFVLAIFLEVKVVFIAFEANAKG